MSTILIVCRWWTFFRRQKIQQGRLYSYATVKYKFIDFLGQIWPVSTGRDQQNNKWWQTYQGCCRYGGSSALLLAHIVGVVMDDVQFYHCCDNFVGQVFGEVPMAPATTWNDMSLVRGGERLKQRLTKLTSLGFWIGLLLLNFRGVRTVLSTFLSNTMFRCVCCYSFHGHVGRTHDASSFHA